jgi:hypothetical protein
VQRGKLLCALAITCGNRDHHGFGHFLNGFDQGVWSNPRCPESAESYETFICHHYSQLV